MSYFTYVLYSKKFDWFYKGHCQDLNKRLQEHNRGETKSTKHFVPWEIVYHETFNTRMEAIKREKYFKTAAGRRSLSGKINF